MMTIEEEVMMMMMIDTMETITKDNNNDDDEEEKEAKKVTVLKRYFFDEFAERPLELGCGSLAWDDEDILESKNVQFNFKIHPSFYALLIEVQHV